MPFSIPCTHCRKTNEPYLDPASDKVFCGLCDQELNISHFVKIQMKTLKQFKQKTSTSFSVKCQSCNKEARPILKNNDVFCPSCQKPHSHFSSTFKLMLKEQLKKVNQD